MTNRRLFIFCSKPDYNEYFFIEASSYDEARQELMKQEHPSFHWSESHNFFAPQNNFRLPDGHPPIESFSEVIEHNKDFLEILHRIFLVVNY